MKIICAIDSFKGSLSSRSAASLAEKEVQRMLPESEFIGLSVADGGEGTAEAVVAACKGRFREVIVQDPLGRAIKTRYGILPDGTALIEMAAASGLTLVSEGERDPLRATTFGTGQLILDALDQGANAIVLGLGGSATNDAGTGALEALGVRFLDEAGNSLRGNGENLERIAGVDITGLDPRIEQTRFTALCDVDSPLVGMNGATIMYGHQKGASDAGLQRLELGMKSYLEILKRSIAEFDEMPGDGAAGGMGMAARIFLHAKRERGADWILDSIGFDHDLRDADICLTGEGHADGQSINGKLVSRIAKRCRTAGVPCIAIVGGMDQSACGLEDCGVNAIYPSVIDCCSREEAMEHAERNFCLAVDRVLATMKIGLKAGREEDVSGRDMTCRGDNDE